MLVFVVGSHHPPSRIKYLKTVTCLHFEISLQNLLLRFKQIVKFISEINENSE